MNKTNALWYAVVLLAVGVASAMAVKAIAAQEQSVHDTIAQAQDTDSNYIETPTGATRVYKFVDTDGSVCYIAESQRYTAVSLQCDIRTPEQTQ